MKKTGLILTLIVFLVCGIVGFKMASLAYPALVSTPYPTAAVVSTAHQQNLFLIHIADLKNDPPELVSVWVLFLLYSDTPSMVFMPVLMIDPAQPLPEPARHFALQSDGAVSPEFIETLRSSLDIPIDGYVILDDTGLRIFADHFPGEDPTPRPYEQARPDETFTIQSMCAYLQSPAARSGVPLPWSLVLPDHFRTDINFDPFMANWIRLTQAPSPPACEIISR